MLASAGYHWLIIPLEKRNEYFAALEKARAEATIVPFAQFLAGIVGERKAM